MIGPARLASRRTRVPVFTFRTEPGVIPVWAMRLDHDAVAAVDGDSHVHDFPGIVYFEAGDGMLIRPGELVEIDDPDTLVAARGWGLYFRPDAVLGSGPADPAPADRQLAWRVHPLLRPFATYDDQSPQRFRVPAPERPAWTAALTAIEREMHQRRDGYQHAALGHLVVLLVAAGRLIADTMPADGGRNDLLDRVLHTIDSGFRGPLSLADVADALHVSSGHLTTIVRERSGRTVQEWIAERRLAEARRLLLETDLAVAEVGRRSGYPDPGYFARVFRRSHGITPRVWRNAH